MGTTVLQYPKMDLKMKSLLKLFLLLAPIGVIEPSVASTAATPGEVFDRYVLAVHDADMDTIRSLIAPDVERSDYIGCTPLMDNPTCLAHYIAVTVVEPKARLTEIQRTVEGETISVDLELRSPLYTKAGVDRIVGRDVLRVHDGLIRSFRFVPDFGDESTAVFFGSLGIGPRAARPSAKP